MRFSTIRIRIPRSPHPSQSETSPPLCNHYSRNHPNTSQKLVQLFCHSSQYPVIFQANDNFICRQFYRFTTTGYYDIEQSKTGLKLIRKPLLEPEEICDPAFMLENWLPDPDPDAYGAFENDRLIGFVEGYLEKWIVRYWITNLHILDTQKRGAGIGTALVARIQTVTCQSGARMIALETQNNNENAIAFYLKNGFTPIGLDLYFYNNTDPEKHNVRLLLGKLLR